VTSMSAAVAVMAFLLVMLLIPLLVIFIEFVRLLGFFRSREDQVQYRRSGLKVVRGGKKDVESDKGPGAA
jgi:hypothetical protein